MCVDNRAYSELPNTRADQNKQVWMEDFFIYTLMSLFKKDKSNLKKIISKKFRNFYFFSAAFYLIMCRMKAPKNFENVAILETRELVSFRGVKTHLG